MTDPEIPQTAPEPSENPPPPRKKSRWLHHSAWTAFCVLLVIAGSVMALYFWASSAAFEDSMRHRVIAALEESTGGRVEIPAFRWDLLHLRVEADNLTIHGL